LETDDQYRLSCHHSFFPSLTWYQPLLDPKFLLPPSPLPSCCRHELLFFLIVGLQGSNNSDAESLLPYTLRVETKPAAPSVVHGINILNRVSIVLDFDEANYTAWALSFSAVFGQYGLRDHIDGSTAKGDNDWVQNDYAIVSWFYNRISPELLSTIS